MSGSKTINKQQKKKKPFSDMTKKKKKKKPQLHTKVVFEERSERGGEEQVSQISGEELNFLRYLVLLTPCYRWEN